MDLRIAICDDEEQMRSSIERNVKAAFPDAQTELYECGEALLQNAAGADIIILDICMEGVSGMETARILRMQNSAAVIIFVTALEEYVYEAFDVSAFYYLVKPLDKVRFHEVLKKAVKKVVKRQTEREKAHCVQAEGASISIKTGKITQKIYLDEIFYIEVFNRKCILYRREDAVEFYGKLTALEKSLGADFFRSHRSCLVNLKYVSKYDSEHIILENGMEVLLAKQRYAMFVKCYMQYANHSAHMEAGR